LHEKYPVESEFNRQAEAILGKNKNEVVNWRLNLYFSL